jgi:hypothetical protein
MTNVSMPTTANVAKVAKTNPGDSYVGTDVTSKNGDLVINYRQGKQWTVKAARIKVTQTNFTGRRLTVEFYDQAGNQVMNRRVYREWVDRIIDQLEK